MMCDVDDAVAAAVDAPSIHDIPARCSTPRADAYVIRRLGPRLAMSAGGTFGTSCCAGSTGPPYEVEVAPSWQVHRSAGRPSPATEAPGRRFLPRRPRPDPLGRPDLRETPPVRQGAWRRRRRAGAGLSAFGASEGCSVLADLGARAPGADLGIRPGLRMVIEYAQHVAGIEGRRSSEFDPQRTPAPVIATSGGQRASVDGAGDPAARCAPARNPAQLAPGSVVAQTAGYPGRGAVTSPRYEAVSTPTATRSSGRWISLFFSGIHLTVSSWNSAELPVDVHPYLRWHTPIRKPKSAFNRAHRSSPALIGARPLTASVRLAPGEVDPPAVPADAQWTTPFRRPVIHSPSSRRARPMPVWSGCPPRPCRPWGAGIVERDGSRILGGGGPRYLTTRRPIVPVQQYRSGSAGSWEIPAGLRDVADEPPFDCAGGSWLKRPT